MSGICGICRFDGVPVDGEVLARMVASLRFRGPDADAVWLAPEAGLGHSLLRTRDADAGFAQPGHLDSRFWVTADIRLDDRGALDRKLAAKGFVASGASDALVVLYAYRAWGADCVKHLLGDFSFAIWDAEARQLFCARDQVGVKPFFYSFDGRQFAFSNTLPCLHLLPGATGALNELAIADFLLFGANQEPDTTCFAQFARLPPGHALVVSESGLRLFRYWRLPSGTSIEFRKESEYVERFQDLLERAVHDRIGSDGFGLELTGGMDSSSVAAIAQELRSKRGGAPASYAQTVVYEHLIPDRERHYASLVAERLGIDIDFIVADGYRLFEDFGDEGMRTPEPEADPTRKRSVDCFRRAAAATRVMLTGWEGDGFLNESPKPYFRSMLRRGRLARVLREGVGYARNQGIVVPRALAARWRSLRLPPVAVLDWIAPSLDRRLGLTERFRSLRVPAPPPGENHPRAHQTLLDVVRTTPLFEYYDPGQTGLAIEYRHPLMDLRLIEFILGLPVYPWCIQKYILRQAMRGRLPEEVRLRPKSPLAGYPYLERLKMGDQIPEGPENPELKRFLKPERIPSMHGAEDAHAAWANFRPTSLNIWLNQRDHRGAANERN